MRRLVQAGSALITLAALAIVLYNATLVDRLPPSVARITLSAAAGDPHLGLTLTAIDVSFSEPVRTDTVEPRFRVSPSITGAFAWDGPTTLIFTPSRKLPADTPFTVSIAPGFEDLAGNAAPTGSDEFAFRTVGPPVVASTDPASDATGVPVGGSIHLTFDRLMDTGAVEGAVAIDPGASVRASWNGPTLTLTPVAPLLFGTTYTVSVGTDASDTDGSHMAQSVQFRFTTVSAGLEARTIVPAPNSSGVSVRTQIALVFDHPLDPASIANALTIEPAVQGDLTVSELAQDPSSPAAASASASPSASAPDGTVLTFTPSSPLQPHTTYTVSLSPVVRRADAPDQVARNLTWTFTTGQPTASAQNQIAFLSARAGVQNLWLMNPDGSNPRQITTEIAPVTSFDVRGDGQVVAYAVAGTVVTMRVDGSDRHVVTQSGNVEYGPLFTPDGGSYLVARRDAAGNDLGYWLVPLPGNLAGNERQVLASGAPPLGSVPQGAGLDASGAIPVWMSRAAFSPDGRLVLIVTASGTPQLVDLGTDSTIAMTVPIVASSEPVWSASSLSFLLVGQDTTRSTALFVIRRSGLSEDVGNAAGSIAVASTGGVATLSGPGSGASPISPHVAYAAQPSATPFPLTTAPDLVDRTPAFAPDGRSILFVRAERTDPTRSNGIWSVGLDGRELRQISPDGVYPRWLP